MKVVFYSRFGNLGGVATQLMARESVLARHDDMERIYCFGTDHGLSTIWPATAPAHFGIRPTKFGRLLRQFKPDIVLGIDSPEIIPVARDIVGKGRVITEVHTTVQSGLVYLNDPACVTEWYFVPSRYSRSIVSRYELVDSKRVHVIPNIIPDAFAPDESMAQSHSRPIVAWVGKLDEHKNWQLALEIAARCRHLDFELWIVGGETAREDVVQRFFQKSFELGIHDRMRWIDRLDYSKMPDLYRLVRASGGAHLVTSSDESFGMTVAEAIACACPVIAPRTGALPELEYEPETPLLFTPGDRESASRLLETQLTGAAPSNTGLLLAAKSVREHHGSSVAGNTFMTKLKDVNNP